MENDKATYEEIEKELNEYKGLLWQLMDEYKLNLGNAEKLLEEEQLKCQELQKNIGEISPEESGDFLSKLGLPACIFDNNGQLIKHNNKFKFLVELLSLEVESISNISVLFDLNKLDGLTQKFNDFIKKEEGLLQSLFRVENPFQGTINLLVRIYTFEEQSKHLAIFIELSKQEIKNLCVDRKSELTQSEWDISDENISLVDEDLAALKTDIAVFSEKYDLFDEISKSGDFSSENKAVFKPLLDTIRRSFNLDSTRTRIVDKLQVHFKSFILHINQSYPELTNNEEKHCMLIKAGLTYKEIASIMGISINGVKIARNRLRKKFELENETKTSDFIDKI